jgi:hypothetical protein
MQVRQLVEVGAADPSLMDRWQQTPLQEATRSGAAPLVSYLSGKAPATGECSHCRNVVDHHSVADESHSIDITGPVPHWSAT